MRASFFAGSTSAQLIKGLASRRFHDEIYPYSVDALSRHGVGAWGQDVTPPSPPGSVVQGYCTRNSLAKFTGRNPSATLRWSSLAADSGGPLP
jgi:hypothetical protein